MSTVDVGEGAQGVERRQARATGVRLLHRQLHRRLHRRLHRLVAADTDEGAFGVVVVVSPWPALAARHLCLCAMDPL